MSGKEKLSCAGSCTVSVSGQRNVVVTPLGPSANLRTTQWQFGNSVPQSNLQPPLDTNRQVTVGATIKCVLLRAVINGGSKEGKMFTIRNVNTKEVNTCDGLKGTIRKQLVCDIVDGPFDVGFVEGSNVVRIRSKEDLSELWSALMKPGCKKILWCDGLADGVESVKNNRRKRALDSGETGTHVAKKKTVINSNRDEKVQDAVDSLKKAHGSFYTMMQFRIWAEMLISGMHASFEQPPVTSMFKRAGGSSTPVKSKEHSASVKVLTDAAAAFATAISPGVTGVSASPVRVIDSRSKLYKQLNELQALRASEIITDEEYEIEKTSILTMLRQLRK